MATQISSFVPNISTPAGSTLTFANWEAAGVRSIAICLAELIMKPGLSYLMHLGSIRKYYRWEHEIILNASRLVSNQEGIFQIRSSYDGSLIELSPATFFSLVSSLQPNKINLPFDNSHYPHEINKLTLQGIEILAQPIDSDAPAKAGMQGQVCAEEGLINILDASMAMDFNPISNHCACKTCQQPFSRAYLHHLLQNTPLLAQRFLIQHNVFNYVFFKPQKKI